MSAPVFGLVLAGGLSTRMGVPKSTLRFRDVDQAHALTGLLGDLCGQAWLSLGKWGDASPLYTDLRIIKDRLSGIGPAAGLLAAWEEYPEAAWLTIAVDMPAVDQWTLARLMRMRNADRAATVALNMDTGYLEPLCAIYEPRFRTELLAEVAVSRTGLAGIIGRLRGRQDEMGIVEVPIDECVALVDVDTQFDMAAFLGGVA